jgi:hypothetical protein
MAHEMVKNMRAHYEFDVRGAEGKKPESGGGVPPWVTMRQRFFGG